ncbi:hypothetical protein GCM10010435_33350 [Winogradskya consettensis]|uniref:Uncharacterized protein n=1 Tax=Winogradskya consettensis TaxID=113560 RepID=A0A919SE78_9ACTN|nr:hypothetical protein [Actinoplanes consettensis]GIM70037.1 hypothetical protein Aco04nite_18140 [Actinoplanes consettensis]
MIRHFTPAVTPGSATTALLSPGALRLPVARDRFAPSGLVTTLRDTGGQPLPERQ